MTATSEIEPLTDRRRRPTLRVAQTAVATLTYWHHSPSYDPYDECWTF